MTDQVWDSKFRFAGLPTGTRVARMLLKRNIESYVTIDGQVTNVVFFGQLQTCKYCSEFVHNGISCVQNKKLLVQKTYANVAKQTVTNPSAAKPTATKQKTPFSKLFRSKSKETKQQSQNQPTKMTAAESAVAAPKQTMPITSDQTTSSSPLTKTNVAEKSGSLMAPPAAPQSVQTASRMTTRQASDGNETDISSASTSSKRRCGRPPGKKLRHNHDDDVNAELDD